MSTFLFYFTLDDKKESRTYRLKTIDAAQKMLSEYYGARYDRHKITIAYRGIEKTSGRDSFEIKDKKDNVLAYIELLK